MCWYETISWPGYNIEVSVVRGGQGIEGHGSTSQQVKAHIGAIPVNHQYTVAMHAVVHSAATLIKFC